jgi:hypothetical protein
MAFVTGLILVPSQFRSCGTDSQKAIDQAADGALFRIEKFSVDLDETYFICRVRLICVDAYCHANLSQEMVLQLRSM